MDQISASMEVIMMQTEVVLLHRTNRILPNRSFGIIGKLDSVGPLTLGSIQFTKVNSSSYNIANHKSESFPAPLKKFNKIFHAIPLEPDVDKII